MPYIKQEKRDEFDHEGLNGRHPKTKTAGELNYELTLKVFKHLTVNGVNYQTMNDVLGALEGCKQEFYRRVVAPYEDQKIKENGDVY